MSEDISELKNKCNKMVEEFYSNGKELRSTELKNYTSGDGENDGLECLFENIVKEIISHLDLDDRVEISNEYLGDKSSEDEDPQRLDIHVMADNKALLMIESRAWIDKPFYTLKRAVIKNIRELEHTKKCLHDDCEFILLSLAIAVKDRLRKSLDKTQGHGELIKEFVISPYPRGYKKKNYFYFGHKTEEIDKLVEFVYNKLLNYKNRNVYKVQGEIYA